MVHDPHKLSLISFAGLSHGGKTHLPPSVMVLVSGADGLSSLNLPLTSGILFIWSSVSFSYSSVMDCMSAAFREGHRWTPASIPALIQDAGIYNCRPGDPLADYGCPPRAVICLIRGNGLGAM